MEFPSSSVGYIIVIKRSGKDGTIFPMNQQTCIIGKHSDCDIRVQLETVSMRHASLIVEPDGKCCLLSLNPSNPVAVNGKPLGGSEQYMLQHKDLIIVGDRCLRWEYDDRSPHFSHTASSFVFATPTTFTGIATPVRPVPGSASSRKRKACFDESFGSASKRKRVSFGPYLSPEHFDKQLPSSTPLRKGEKPAFSTPIIVGSPYTTVAVKQALQKSSAKSSETPTKSLLRRRSPTPIKPYFARSHGFVVLGEESKLSTSPRTRSCATKSVSPKVQKNTSEAAGEQSSVKNTLVASLKGKRTKSLSPSKKITKNQSLSKSISPSRTGFLHSSNKVTNASPIGTAKASYRKRAKSISPAAQKMLKKHKTGRLSECAVRMIPAEKLKEKSMKVIAVSNIKGYKMKTDKKTTLCMKLNSASEKLPNSPDLFATPKSFKNVKTPSPVKKAVTPTSSQNVRTPSLGKKVSSNSPITKARTPSPGRKTRTPSPGKKARTPSSGRKSKTPSPCRKARTPSPGRKVRTPSPGRKVRTPSPGRKAMTPSCGKKARTPSPGRKARTPSPGRKARTPSPGRKARTPSPGRKARTPSPGRKARTPSPGKKARTPSPGKKARTPSPGKKAGTPSPGKKAGTPSPGKKAGTPSPGKKARTPSPGKKARTPSPGKKARTPSPGREARTPSPGKNTGTPRSGKKFMAFSTGNKSRSLSTGRKSRTPSLGQKTKKSSLGQNTKTPSPGQKTRTPSPGHNAGTPSPRKKARISSPGQKASTPSSGKRSLSPNTGNKIRTPNFDAKIKKRHPANKKRVLSIDKSLKYQTPKFAKGSFASIVKRNTGVPKNIAVQRAMKAVVNAKLLKVKKGTATNYGSAHLQYFKTLSSSKFGVNSTGHANSPAPIIIYKKLNASDEKIYRTGPGSLKKKLRQSKLVHDDLTGLTGIGEVLSSPKPSEVSKLISKSEKRTPRSGRIKRSPQPSPTMPQSRCKSFSLLETPQSQAKSPVRTPRLTSKHPETIPISASSCSTTPRSASKSPQEVQISVTTFQKKRSVSSQRPSRIISSSERRPKFASNSPKKSSVSTPSGRYAKSVTTSPQRASTFDHVSPLKPLNSASKTPQRTPRRLAKFSKSPTKLTYPVNRSIEIQNTEPISHSKSSLSSDTASLQSGGINIKSLSKSTLKTPASSLSKTSLVMSAPNLFSPRNVLSSRHKPKSSALFIPSPKGRDESSLRRRSLYASKRNEHIPLARKSRSLIPQRSVNISSADVSNVSSSIDLTDTVTPDITQERFISPLGTPSLTRPDTRLMNLMVLDTSAGQRTNSSSTTAEYRDLSSVLATPKSPVGDCPNVQGIRRLKQTPLEGGDCGNAADGRKLLCSSETPGANYANVSGVKQLLSSPRTPGVDYRDVQGVKQLLQTRRTPSIDYRNVEGLKRLLKSPRSPGIDYRDVSGIQRLMNISRSPRNDSLDVTGVKRFVEKSVPQPDYTNVDSIKRLFSNNRNVTLSDSLLESLSHMVKSPVLPEQPLQIHEILSVVKGPSPSSASSSRRQIIKSPVQSKTSVEPIVIDLESESEETGSKKEGCESTVVVSSVSRRGAKRLVEDTTEDSLNKSEQDSKRNKKFRVSPPQSLTVGSDKSPVGRRTRRRVALKPIETPVLELPKRSRGKKAVTLVKNVSDEPSQSAEKTLEKVAVVARKTRGRSRAVVKETPDVSITQKPAHADIGTVNNCVKMPSPQIPRRTRRAAVVATINISPVKRRGRACTKVVEMPKGSTVASHIRRPDVLIESIGSSENSDRAAKIKTRTTLAINIGVTSTPVVSQPEKWSQSVNSFLPSPSVSVISASPIKRRGRSGKSEFANSSITSEVETSRSTRGKRTAGSRKVIALTTVDEQQKTRNDTSTVKAKNAEQGDTVDQYKISPRTTRSVKKVKTPTKEVEEKKITRGKRTMKNDSSAESEGEQKSSSKRVARGTNAAVSCPAESPKVLRQTRSRAKQVTSLF